MSKVINYLGQSGKVKAGCLISILIVVLLAAGGGYMAYKMGLEMLAEQVTAMIKDDAAIKEHIGEIQELSMNLTATGQATEDQKQEGEGGKKSVLVFDIVGSKGAGRLAVTLDGESKDSEAFSAATLTTDDGKSFPIVLKRDEPVAVEEPAEKPADAPVEEQPAAPTK